jgi:hypothetical protein
MVGAGQRLMDKDSQIRELTRALIALVPPARAVATNWAVNLYEQGVRVHPELVENQVLPPARQRVAPEVRSAVEDKAMATLLEMGQQFPELAPLVTKVQTAATPAERAAALLEMRNNIQPEVFEGVEQRIEQLRDSS